ncbi:MAG: DUF3108 domain-containing protein [candidate division Zixibacteria bacterium]|nr:DUF3108 domain-containing protein [candidate division Zixibacteria bacterium]
MRKASISILFILPVLALVFILEGWLGAEDSLPEKADAVQTDSVKIIDPLSDESNDQDGMDSSGIVCDDTTPHQHHRVLPNQTFGAGEHFEYVVKYGFITAGSAYLDIDTVVPIRGHQAYRITSRAKSSSFFSKFYNVNDRAESYLDVEGIYPVWFEKHLREGKYKSDRWVRFDHTRHIAVSSKGDTLKIPPFVQDVLSVMYYVRTQPLEVGKSVLLDNYADGKNYPLEVKVLRKEKKKVEAGVFNCIVVEPLIQEGAGIFVHKGSITVWLTDDKNRLPIYMKSQVILIGSISAELKKFKLGNPYRASK